MLANKDFESNCKRIAKAIMKKASDLTSGTIDVEVSSALFEEYNKDKGKHISNYVKNINKQLKGCVVSHKAVIYCGRWIIQFEIKFN